jgi:hypothetical protein
MAAAITYEVTRFKTLTLALKELEGFAVHNAESLQTGRPLGQFGDLRPRELLGNWLVCAAINSTVPAQPERFTFVGTSDPVGGDGVILDTVTGDTRPTEHILVPRQSGGEEADIEALILGQVAKKRDKGGAAYASGKTLVVFREAEGLPWFPNRVARRLPDDLAFVEVWVVGLERVEDGQYVYFASLLDVSEGDAPTWRIRIAPSFDRWAVEVVQ